jgi:carboxyl-terminal processing protease
MKKYFVAGIALGVTVTLVAQMIVFGFSFFRVQRINTFFNEPTVKEQSETSNSSSTESEATPVDLDVEGFSNSSYDSFDEKAYDVLEILNQYYYENVEEQELYEEAIRGMVAGIGDPYTSYFTKEEYASFNEKMEGSYEGIGVVVSYGDSEDIILVVAPFKNSPGEKAGVKPSDRIIGVDGIDVIGLKLDEVVSMIKGEKGTTVTLRVLRGEEEIDIPIKRDVIEIPTVEKEMLEGQIGYIQMSGFDLITEEQFKKALEDLENEDQKGLIIDVRNNPGGYLHICIAIVEELLDKDMLVVYTEDKTGKREELITQDRDRFEKPLVILINGNSASASEILAGAIKDHEKGLIVGETSFGKGLVQRTFDLDDKSAVKVTISKYFTPDGYYIHDVGIVPDVEVIYNPESEVDDQLNKAIEVINEMINQ